jgi:apolipoprotein N-acyltransferase
MLRALRPTRADAAAAAASGALFAIAFPPFPLVVPAFLCLVPFAVALARAADAGDGVRRGARLGFWAGFVGYGAMLYWIGIALAIYTKLSFLGYAASVMVMAAWTALGGAALYVVRRTTGWPMAVALPVVWVTLELWINYVPDLAFPWLPLGLAVARHPLLAQAADLTGVRGLSFWIVLTNGLLADAWLLRTRRAVAWRGAAAAAAAAAVCAYGWWRISTVPLRDLGPIAAVQPNVPQDEKWEEENRDEIVRRLARLTRARTDSGDPALVIWPEVALPGFLSQHPDWQDTLRVLSTGGGTPILFGALDARYSGPRVYEYFNAALLVDERGVLNAQPPYHKRALVPVVERVPFLNPRWFSKLKFFGGFGRGTNAAPFRFAFGDAGVLICYESIFPEVSRAFRRDGAEILLNITNDAWFGRSLAPYQHEAHVALRAIETRTGIVRAANTGITEYVDPLGRVHGPTPLFVEESRVYQVQTSDVTSPYVAVGDWLSAICAVLTLALVARGTVHARRARRAPAAAPAAA